MNNLTRRNALQGWLAGAGFLGLRSLATGLPISFLVNPRSARAADACGTGAGAQYLILSMSASGDALNCNVPGIRHKALERDPRITEAGTCGPLHAFERSLEA